MTEVQQKFVALERQKEEIKKFFEKLAEATEALSKEVGINGYFQDDQGIVYKVVIPEGKFVYYDKISYVRTRRPDETRGDLSIKEATEAGFRLAERK